MKRFDPVRIVVVGVGNFGKLHARTIGGLAEAELAGVVDTNLKAVESLRKELPGVRFWPRLEDALEESNAEAYVIATQTGSHIDLAEKILRKDLKVLVEKPLTTNAESALRLKPYIKRNSSNFMAGHIFLFAPEGKRLIWGIEG